MRDFLEFIFDTMIALGAGMIVVSIIAILLSDVSCGNFLSHQGIDRQQHCIQTLSSYFPGFDSAPEVCDSILFAPIPKE